MDIASLKHIVSCGESHTVEFKKSTGLLSAAFEALCGFLNSDGGCVLLGVSNDGEIIGQEITDKIQQTIANEIQKIEPHTKVKVSYVPIQRNALAVIALEVPSGARKPYTYDGRPYQREQTTTRRMPQNTYAVLLSQREPVNFAWERMPAPRYHIKDLDTELIWGVVRKGVETKKLPESALRQNLPKVLELLKLTTETHQLNNAAIALFARKMSDDFPQCTMKMARFKGKDRTEFLDQERLTENAFELLEHGMQFVKRHLPVAATIPPDQLRRVEKPLIPFNAIREALINAFCHRDYSIVGGSIGMAIYDDRMEIFNDGGIFPGTSVEKLKSGFSRLRNQVIAGVFHRADLIEIWGRGVQKMIELCRDAGDPEPIFEWDSVEFKVTFPFPHSIHPPVINFENPAIDLENLSIRQRKILTILGDGKPHSRNEIVSNLGEKVPERTLSRDLDELKEIGLITSTGHTRQKTWVLLR